MECEMETTRLADGQYVHRCRRCGVERISDTPNYVRHCEAAECAKAIAPADRPAATKEAMPSLPRMAWNLTQSLADFARDGFKTVDEAQYQARLEICDGCVYRRDNRCVKCGCYLTLKARGRAFQCPMGQWPVLPEEGVPRPDRGPSETRERSAP